MVTIRQIGVLTGRQFTAAMEHVGFSLDASGPSPVVRAVSFTTRTTVSLSLAEGALAVEAGAEAQSRGRIGLTVDGVAGTVAAAAVEAARLDGAEGRSTRAFIGEGGFLFPGAVELLVLPGASGDLLVAARPEGRGIEVFRLPASGDPVRIQTVADTVSLLLSGVNALASAQVGAARLVFAGSLDEHGITVLRLGSDGRLTVVSDLGPDDWLPVSGITALRSVEYGGATWLIAAASGSSSLTVFRVGADGGLTVADHLIDSRDTRFQSVRAIEVIEAAGRVFVLAAGADDGLSLFSLLPDGRLLHLQSLADSAETALSNVTALRAVQLGGVIQILAVSGAEPGLSVLEIDLSGLGTVVQGGAGRIVGGARADMLIASAQTTALAGGDGADILIDGPGAQEMSGGRGQDVFVMTAGGGANVITDFEPGVDRIDLSGWRMFRGAAQLTFTATATGGIIEFGAERLVIHTSNGRPLTSAQVMAMDFGAGVQRIEVVLAHDYEETEEVVVTPPPTTPTPSPPPATRHDGTSGADLLRGTSASESFYGMAGNDTFVGGGGADSFYGGAGFDIVSYEGLAQGLVIDLAERARSSAEFRDDLFDGIEGFRGTAHGDRFTGAAAGGNWFDGAGGNDTITGRGGRDTLYGGDGNDVIAAAGGANLIYGGAGNDTITGGTGNDTIYGGTGRDSIYGGGGNDLIYGGGGGSRIETGAGNDTIHAGNGGARVLAGTGNDSVIGGDGNDEIVLGAGHDYAEGGAGNDNIAGGAGNDTIYGGAGNDSIGGGEGDDVIYGGAGNDTIGAGPGNDLVYAGAGRDVISTGAGNDTIHADGGDNQIGAGDGQDLVHGGSGRDTIGGGEGRDTIYGGGGDDEIGAGPGDDLVYGGSGNDFLAGGPGHDTIYGGPGDDRINGGPGNDVVYGGAGADIFIFAEATPGDTDRIMDFENGIDRIRLGGLAGATAHDRFAALSIQDISYAGDRGAMIQYGGQRIFLPGISASLLDVSDFIFT
ncbi:hypothetical protein [Pseudogemmobacter sonorensis]|uniref:hypothetical protein n=1 Tax=Pseudogemmobacter sonorensis TaxID=2989681 RepID=UPI00367552C6